MAFFRILLRQAFRGKELQNVFHVEDPTSLLAQEAINNIIIAKWIPEMRRIQSSQLNYFQVHCTRILVPDPLATTVTNVNILGAVGATQAISFECYRIRFNSDLLGKRHRGGYFLGGLSQGFISQNAEGLPAIGLTEAAEMTANLQFEFTGDPSQSGINLVIAHKDDSTPTRVSDIAFNIRLTSLRSRKVIVGI